MLVGKLLHSCTRRYYRFSHYFDYDAENDHCVRTTYVTINTTSTTIATLHIILNFFSGNHICIYIVYHMLYGKLLYSCIRHYRS